MTDGKIKVPGIGEVPRKYVLIGGAVVAVLVGYAWWRNSTGNSTAQGSGVAGTDLTTDQLPGGDGYANPNPGASGSDSVDQTAASSTTDQSWAAAAAAELAGRSDYDGPFITATIAKYLNGQSLTATEAELIRVAWAFAGKPPSNPPLITTTGGGTGGTGSGSGTGAGGTTQTPPRRDPREAIRARTDNPFTPTTPTTGTGPSAPRRTATVTPADVAQRINVVRARRG
jgi:hypothetical protein